MSLKRSAHVGGQETHTTKELAYLNPFAFQIILLGCPQVKVHVWAQCRKNTAWKCKLIEIQVDRRLLPSIMRDATGRNGDSCEAQVNWTQWDSTPSYRKGQVKHVDICAYILTLRVLRPSKSIYLIMLYDSLEPANSCVIFVGSGFGRRVQSKVYSMIWGLPEKIMCTKTFNQLKDTYHEIDSTLGSKGELTVSRPLQRPCWRPWDDCWNIEGSIDRVLVVVLILIHVYWEGER